MKATPITGTFLDEISHDIPHQNWGFAEWELDFKAMQVIGIDTVILIRSGYKQWLTYPSEVLVEKQSCYSPSVDLVDMFLTLAEKFDIDFFFGTYDLGHYWQAGDYQKEIDLNRAAVDEVWQRYGERAAFKGWYLSQEVSRRTKGIIDVYAQLGKHCKDISGEKIPILISPWMEGIKSVTSFGAEIYKSKGITI